VNHLVLQDGTALSGVVSALHRGSTPAGPGLETALAVLSGPTLLSRGGVAVGPPVNLPAAVAFGDVRIPYHGSFCLTFKSGLALFGRSREGIACELRASIGSRELEVPDCLALLSSPSLPSVAGGPGDPAVWDFGAEAGPSDDAAEARARAHRAHALAPQLAELYSEVRGMRESGRVDRARLAAVADEARGFSEDWLLAEEIDELAAKPRRAAR
jgi:phenylalanine-4-hydroxylase